MRKAGIAALYTINLTVSKNVLTMILMIFNYLSLRQGKQNFSQLFGF